MKPTYYIALEIPSEIKKQITRICIGIPSVNWLEESDLYLILRGLGNLDGADLIDIKTQLKLIPYEKITLTLQNCRFLHSKIGHGGIVSLYTSQNRELEKLVSTLHSSLKELKLPEMSKQDPHVILGFYEHKLPPQKMANYLESTFFFQTPEFETTKMQLIMCQHTAKGFLLSSFQPD